MAGLILFFSLPTTPKAVYDTHFLIYIMYFLGISPLFIAVIAHL